MLKTFKRRFTTSPNEAELVPGTETVAERQCPTHRKSKSIMSFLSSKYFRIEKPIPGSSRLEPTATRLSSIVHPRPSLQIDSRRAGGPSFQVDSRPARLHRRTHNRRNSHEVNSLSISRPYTRARSNSDSENRMRARSAAAGIEPPRFDSVMRVSSPRYSTFARRSHATVRLDSEAAISVLFNSSMQDPPPPAYSRFDPHTVAE
ncbi:hypothetical protein C8J56DRAFT_340708 [Mycena floridula]|nr:hypothetical protein C8J56DRAFT_340708 [Mycena floridula]